MPTDTEDSQSSHSVAVGAMPANPPSRVLPVTTTSPIMTPPLEILEMIFSECDEDDEFWDTRPDLRLTCRAFESIVADMLAREWSGCLDVPLNMHSMDGLVGIRPIFASHLKFIRICTRRLNKIPELDCSDPELNRERWEILTEKLGWSYETYEKNLARLNGRIVSHNQKAEEQQKFFMAGASLSNLLKALQNLRKCHNNSVTLGVYDFGWRTPCDFEKGLKHFGVDTAYITDDASSTLQILASVVSYISHSCVGDESEHDDFVTSVRFMSY
ncbi:hypothetical protein KCU91_g15904, partial [Aureobasidium melanogenum]